MDYKVDIRSLGWHTLSVPNSAVDSPGLIDRLADEDVDAFVVVKWEGGRWHIHLKGSKFGVWPVEPGEGYFIRVVGLGPATQ